MAHKLDRLIGSEINNIPALITEDSLREIVSYLENRTEPSAGIKNDPSAQKQMTMTDTMAVIPISGALTYETTFMGALCGMTSYQGLISDVEKAAKAGIKTFVFDADSGGGQAYAMMDTANRIRKRVDDVGGRIITYVDGTCASACFGLAAISDEIIAHPDSRTGSVGVVVKLVNDSKAQIEKGFKTSYITSAKSKVPFDAEGDFKEDFLADIQSQVDELHTEFASHVAGYRDMSLEDVNKTEAKVYSSKKALETGFIDKIMDHDTFFSYLETLNDEGNQSVPLNIFTNSKDKNLATIQEENEMSTEQVTALQAQLDASVESQTELESQLATAVSAQAELTSQLGEATASLEQLNKKAESDKLESRKASLSEYLPEGSVETIFSALSGLDDVAFSAILSTYKTQAVAEEQTQEFNEVGVSGETDPDAKELSGVMNLIKNKKA
jgi:ClpP class serine protease